MGTVCWNFAGSALNLHAPTPVCVNVFRPFTLYMCHRQARGLAGNHLAAPSSTHNTVESAIEQPYSWTCFFPSAKLCANRVALSAQPYCFLERPKPETFEVGTIHFTQRWPQRVRSAAFSNCMLEYRSYVICAFVLRVRDVTSM